MDEREQQGWERAVERKKDAAKKASEATGEQTPKGSAVAGSEHNVVDPSTSQDQPTPHHKGTRHGQVSAENWNQ
jgi:hypothetical protein